MRTYYDLEDYHWKMIEKAGLKKDKKVWVAATRYGDIGVTRAIVDNFDIHIEGEIEVGVKLKLDEPRDWDANPRDYDMLPSTVFMYQVYHTKEEALKFLRKSIRGKIKELSRSIRYYMKELENLTV